MKTQTILELELDGYGKIKMEVKYPSQIHEDFGKMNPVILWFINHEQYYTGVLTDVDWEANKIMLTSLKDKKMIGLPLSRLKYYAVKVNSE